MSTVEPEKDTTVTAIATATAVRPGRQRSEAADASIIDATLQLLCETGYRGLTVAAVIERSGVSSATLYRRWPTKQDLVVAALASLAPEPVETDTGSFAGDLTAFVGQIARAVSVRKEAVADALGIEAKRNPELAALLRERFLAPRLVELGGILARARRRGEIGRLPSTEVALSLVVGPIYHRAFQLRESLTPGFVREVTAFALRAMQP